MNPHLDWRRGITVGRGCLIAETVVIYGHKHITIGDNVRIDDFVVLSASEHGFFIADNVHIGAHCNINGAGGPVTIYEGAGISGRVSVYTASGNGRLNCGGNPQVPEERLPESLVRGRFCLGRRAIVGAGTVIMPKVEVGDNGIVGACSFVLQETSIGPGEVWFGQPARPRGYRRPALVEEPR